MNIKFKWSATIKRLDVQRGAALLVAAAGLPAVRHLPRQQVQAGALHRAKENTGKQGAELAFYRHSSSLHSSNLKKKKIQIGIRFSISQILH